MVTGATDGGGFADNGGAGPAPEPPMANASTMTVPSTMGSPMRNHAGDIPFFVRARPCGASTG